MEHFLTSDIELFRSSHTPSCLLFTFTPQVNLATAHGIIRSITVRLQTAPWCFLHDLQRLQPDMTVPAFTQFVNCTKGDRTLVKILSSLFTSHSVFITISIHSTFYFLLTFSLIVFYAIATK